MGVLTKWAAALAAVIVTLAGVATATTAGAEEAMKITSTTFEEAKEIPKKYTCQGNDVSPPLAWSGVPATTKSLALICDDPDAPDPAAPQMTWVHWVLYDMPPSTTSLPEGVAASALPSPTREGTNDWQRKGYGGPCPPIGRHRYFFKLYALDEQLGDQGALTKSELEAAMKGHVLAQAVLMGTYQKSGN